MHSSYSTECLGHHLMGFVSFIFLMYFVLYYGLYEKRCSKSYHVILFCCYFVNQTIFCLCTVISCEVESSDHDAIKFIKGLLVWSNFTFLFLFGLYVSFTIRDKTQYSMKKIIIIGIIFYMAYLILFFIALAIKSVPFLVILALSAGYCGILSTSYSYYVAYKYTDKQDKIFFIIAVAITVTCVWHTGAVLTGGLLNMIFRIGIIICAQCSGCIGCVELSKLKLFGPHIDNKDNKDNTDNIEINILA